MAAFDFQQRRVLVTGAGQGIGRAIVDYLDSCNAKICAVDREPQTLNKIKQDIPSADTLCINLMDFESTATILNEYLENNEIHHLVNNAGVTRLASIGKIPLADYDFVFDVNVKSLINVTQLVVNQMVKKNIKEGSIVSISSQAGIIALQDHLVYAGSKGALNTMTKVMALELGPHNIRSNCVCPTVTNTAMAALAWPDELAKEFKAKIPLGRFAEPNEIAQPVAFLLSNLSSMITGAVIPVDGGYTAV